MLLWLLVALRSGAVRRELAASWRSLPKLAWAWYGLCVIAIAAFATQPVTWIDTGLYHYGFVRWFAQQGVTPGLTLLNRQFGFVSAWFAIAAPFSPAWLDGRASSLMNGFVTLVAALQISLSVYSILRQRAQHSDWFLALFSICIFGLTTQTLLLSAVTVSASPDIAVAWLTAVIAWCLLVSCPIDTPSEPSALLPIILAAGAESIKLTALPLLVVSAGYYVMLNAHWKRLLKLLLLITVLLLPLLSATVVISSCPLYPSTVLCFDLPWAESEASLNELADASHGWASWYGEPEASNNRTLWLIMQWVQSGPSSKLSAALVVMSLLSALYLFVGRSLWGRLPANASPAGRLTTRNSQRLLSFNLLAPKLYALIALSAVGITFVMLKASLFRFGMGVLLLLPILVVSLACSDLFNRPKGGQIVFPKWALKAGISVCVLCAIALNAHLYSSAGTLTAQATDSWLLPPPLPEVAVTTERGNGTTYYLTQDERGRCWASKLPCVSNLPSDVVDIDPSVGIASGFKHLSEKKAQP